jgi:hypothetical protein
MQILRLKDVRQSRIPETVGCCQSDNGKLIEYVNEAQQRLLFKGGEVGWWGSWMKVVFNVDSQLDPFITLPRSIARLINMDVCRRPVRIQNEFYEFLEAGVGLQPLTNCGGSTVAQHGCNLLETYDRGLFPTFSDLVPPNKRLRFYITDQADVGRRVLVQGTDQNGTTIYSLDGTNEVTGIFVGLTTPFADTPFDITTLTGLQKDFTVGQVKVFEVDMATGTQRLILTMEPTEEVAAYRRYFLNGLPRNCCDPNNPAVTTVQVTAMAKLAFIPVQVDTDYLIIQNLPALKEGCQSVRFGEMDDSLSAGQTGVHMTRALNLLNGELRHHLGKEMPAINFAPFGTAKLSLQRIGSLF